MQPRPLAQATEEELIQLSQERDAAAFEELVRRNTAASFRLALSVLKDRQEAEDQVQTSLLKAWIHLPNFQGGSRFSTWLRSIVMNQSLMRLRQARGRKLESISRDPDQEVPWELPSTHPGPESQLARTQMIEQVKQEVGRLPPIFRDVVVLRDLEERSIEDIAKQLEISIPAVKSRLSRAREMLRQRMNVYSTRFSGTPLS